MGEKAPHSVETQTFWGRFSLTIFRVFRKPSGVVKSQPLNNEARSADNPCFKAVSVRVESGAHAASNKNNLFI